MDYRRYDHTIYARFDRGEELTEQLRILCEKECVRLGHVRALGATDDFTVGVFDPADKAYHALHFTGAHEILSLTGTVTTLDGEYYAHLHLCAADATGRAVGGHLNSCRISVTCELVLEVTDGVLERTKDPELGLNFYDFDKEGAR